jgi:ADP-L-glycero-D-manno-heptose 6-epimerase
MHACGDLTGARKRFHEARQTNAFLAQCTVTGIAMLNHNGRTANIPEGPIVITGGAGMIGSMVAWHLNEACSRDDLIIVDHLQHPDQWQNLCHRRYSDYLDRDQLLPWLQSGVKPGAIIHMGAISATTERDFNLLMKYNFKYSQALWHWCVRNEVPFLYASSAATYGIGEHGYDDNVFDVLRPLNAYGYSKHLFDLWVLRQVARRNAPPHWCGLKFFNVYGPNEYHKEGMASMVWHCFRQIQDAGKVRLFRSAHGDYADGMQRRDFVYVKDAVNVVTHFLASRGTSGIFNVGSGKARTFKDLALAVTTCQEFESSIEWIDMPTDLAGRYQYFTQASLSKLRDAGYTASFRSLEEGVADYVGHYLRRPDLYC